jgi:amino acid transporter
MVEDTVEGDEIPVVNNVIDNTRNEAEPEPSQQTLTIGNTEIPLFGGSDFGNWSLFNVIMSIIMTIVPLLILLKRRKKDEPERWNKLVLFVSTVFGLIVLCIVLIASKFSATMVLFNKWSWLVAAAAVVVAGLMIFAKRSSEAKSGEEQYV